MLLLGKLILDVILFYELIIMVIMMVVVVLGLLVVGLVIKYKKWGVIWYDWIILIDYKCLGVMYIIFVFIMFFCGFVDVIMMWF